MRIIEGHPILENKIEQLASDVFRTEASAVFQMSEQVPKGFERAVRIILSSSGRVIVSGMGKSGHIGRKIAATLASTGTPALFLHPAEASHGDLGMVTKDDVCVLLSNSGETRELGDLIQYAKHFSIPLISVTKCSESTLARQSDVTITLPDMPEACAIGMSPTTSTTCALSVGDALAVVMMKLRGFRAEAFHVLHPGGKLGAQFMRVREIMHSGSDLPIVAKDLLMPDVLLEMTGKGFGLAIIVDQGHLSGIITDGDLRRNLDGLMERPASAVATPDPKWIGPEAFVFEAMKRMQEQDINALCVLEDDEAVIGLIRLYDCLRAGFS